VHTLLDAYSIVGYCAHWRESLSDPDTKILRPQQDYKGVWLRHYGDAAAAAPGKDAPVPLPPSNAYQRRVAGQNWQ
jgi:citrate synthase